MNYKKVIRKRVVDADGRVISEATSQVISGGNGQKTYQSVSTTVTKNTSSSKSSSSSASSSSSSSGSSYSHSQ